MNLQENIQRIKEVMNLKDEMQEEKESGEKWIKCINCKKKFTQTIHKGKKSLPICPNCGTHNSSLKESIIPISIKRRANEEILKKYISLGELNYPTLCNDFNDEYEYSDHVIDYAVDEFLSEHELDIEDEDYYSDVMDYLRSLCRDIFGEYLYELYKNTCSEYNLTEENVIKENDDYQIQWDTIVDLENILNRKIPKKFPWWKDFDLNSIGFSASYFGTVNLYGYLTVDTDWAYKSWNEQHPDIKLTKNIDWALPNFLNVEDYVKIGEMIVKYFNAITGESMERVTMSNISLHLDDFDSKKMEQNEGELTEKCWKGYTQKGMKTMFGKRYPNCVKKKG